MRKTPVIALTFLTLLSFIPNLAAADHLVKAETVAARLAAAAAARQSDRAAVERVLDTGVARAAARSLRADPGQLKAGLSALSDTELRDLAARAKALRADPVAGLSSDVETLLIIFLLVAIVILVLQAAD